MYYLSPYHGSWLQLVHDHCSISLGGQQIQGQGLSMCPFSKSSSPVDDIPSRGKPSVEALTLLKISFLATQVYTLKEKSDKICIGKNGCKHYLLVGFVYSEVVEWFTSSISLLT